MSRCVLAIGSAGHGSGNAKSKAADFGLLDTKTDIQDLEEWCKSRDFEYFGAYEVRGRIGSARDCLCGIERFMDHCRETKQVPFIYYSGHGERGTGNWCFPDGSRIGLEDIVKLNNTGWKLMIHCDCCFSGHWAELAKQKFSHTISHLLCASSASDKARDRWHAQAWFKCDAVALQNLEKFCNIVEYWSGEVTSAGRGRTRT